MEFAGTRLPDGFVCEALMLELDTVGFTAVEEMLQVLVVGLPDVDALLLGVNTGSVALLEELAGAFVADEELATTLPVGFSDVDPSLLFVNTGGVALLFKFPDAGAMLLLVNTGGVALLEELPEGFVFGILLLAPN